MLISFQAGLFSAISSAFIIDMNSDLQPDPLDTTNALLVLVIDALNNQMTPTQPIMSSPDFIPDHCIVASQFLAYLSLSLSILVAFLCVLGKQWLAYFKTSHFGHGSAEERSLRRQKKADAI
ncbi:hypothetical protein M422DRAFT_243515 [Sphaerobolus stellatus SS14]|nr:hypothetical protein M422DRAFT_243515 [Sphaerobolus stellatus SS14]